MSFGDFIQKAKRVFHLSKKPSKKEIRYGIRMNLLALLGLGIVGFLIRIIFFAVGI